MRIPILLSCFCLGVAATPLSASESAATNFTGKPNVIFIMTDDQGSVDLGSYGSKDIETPATDTLAARGVRFTQF